MLLIYYYIFLIPQHRLSTVMRGTKMSTDQEQFKDEKETWGNLPDVDSNRPPHEPVKGVPGDPSPDDDVIDLVDVIMKGEKAQDVETEETVIKEKAEEDSSELPDALEEETAEDRDDTLDSLDFDFKTPEDFEETVIDTFTELPQDDLAEVMANLEDTDATDESGSTAISEELPAISTERLEEIIIETVKNVVERVTRETMSEVAEKVIKEAIEGLKQSLETPAV